MRKAVSEGRFREDLYYRLNTIPIQMPPLRDRGNDVLLLFRLFAMQMAEKYHLPKITLAEDAKQVLLKYKWPGNVRQLKNITEQMSILCDKREIDAEVLSHYIPQDVESTQLATINKPGAHSYESEREILYKILYELRGNVSDLRRDLNSVRKQVNEARDLIGASGFSRSSIETEKGSSRLPILNPRTNSSAANREYPVIDTNLGNIPNTLTAEEAIAEEINEPESLNLNDLGRQMVEKALEKNNGNRKKAAEELGISDRTLYRRIKQYGLESKNNK
jgi:DNA-binding NtrC family response regulator